VYLRPVTPPGQASLESRAGGTDEQFARLAHAAADDEAAGIEDGRQIGHALPEPAAHDAEAAQRGRVTLLGRLGDLRAPDRVRVAPGKLEQAGRPAG
jgi:hypothetical protein